MSDEPKVLIFDIETAPIEAYVWGLWDNNVALNQIVKDWSVLSWSAKWLNSKKVMYEDQRNAKQVRDDKKLLVGIWNLLDEADVVITQNGKKFDQKKLNSRFVINGFNPPSSFKHIDTFLLAKKHFGFTSNKLEYMSDKLCTKYKKLKHNKFPGQELWTECLKNNQSAWKEMERYNKHDVLALEELYKKLIPYDNTVNFNVFSSSSVTKCSCGSVDFIKNGYSYTGVSRYDRFKCRKCGSELRSRRSNFSIVKKRSLMVGTVR